MKTTSTQSVPPQDDQELRPRITVIGVGGGGGNAVNNMIRSKLEGVEFLISNTDAQALRHSMSDRKIQLGLNITQGLGAGAKPEVGRAAAEETLEEILGQLSGTNMLFIAAGMGGGTGTGAAPVIARAAREQGILTIGVVTKPFHFEGAQRMKTAERGIEELQQYVDTLIIIPNQNLFRIANEKTTFADAFKMADDVLYSGVRGVTDLMIMPGLINLDFADIRTVMGEMGKAMMGTGEAEGDRRAITAAEAAISNPLLDDVSMRGAKGVLINITGGMDMTLFEVDEATNRIREEVGDQDAQIIFGSTFDEKLNGRIRVSVVATGIDAQLALPLAQRQANKQQTTTVVANAANIAAQSLGQTTSFLDELNKTESIVEEAAPTPQVEVMVPQESFEATIELTKEIAVEQQAIAQEQASQSHAQEEKSKRRGPTLFERFTGGGRLRFGANQMPESPKNQPTQPLRQVSPKEGNDDGEYLDIPAFLRRQDGGQ